MRCVAGVQILLIQHCKGPPSSPAMHHTCPLTSHELAHAPFILPGARVLQAAAPACHPGPVCAHSTAVQRVRSGGQVAAPGCKCQTGLCSHVTGLRSLAAGLRICKQPSLLSCSCSPSCRTLPLQDRATIIPWCAWPCQCQLGLLCGSLSVVLLVAGSNCMHCRARHLLPLIRPVGRLYTAIDLESTPDSYER